MTSSIPRADPNPAWAAGYLDGWDAGARSRPTDAEIRAWSTELAERAYAAGYRDGLAVDQHRRAARALTDRAELARSRARPGSGYIPRTGSAQTGSRA